LMDFCQCITVVIDGVLYTLPGYLHTPQQTNQSNMATHI
jgi:hypothetical protein